jgi:hypothetical protein
VWIFKGENSRVFYREVGDWLAGGSNQNRDDPTGTLRGSVGQRILQQYSTYHDT